MWIEATDPQCVAELFHNYAEALGVGVSESRPWNESTKHRRSSITLAGGSALQTTKTHEHLARPDEAASFDRSLDGSL